MKLRVVRIRGPARHSPFTAYTCPPLSTLTLVDDRQHESLLSVVMFPTILTRRPKDALGSVHHMRAPAARGAQLKEPDHDQTS